MCVAGQLTSAVVSFAGLLSQPNAMEPEFQLNCRSQGGPATTVQWTRDSNPVTKDATHSTSLSLIEPQQNTVYESRLRVSGRELGQYACTVSSNRAAYFGATGSSVSSQAFPVTGECVPPVNVRCDSLHSPRGANQTQRH